MHLNLFSSEQKKQFAIVVLHVTIYRFWLRARVRINDTRPYNIIENVYTLFFLARNSIFKNRPKKDLKWKKLMWNCNDLLYKSKSMTSVCRVLMSRADKQAGRQRDFRQKGNIIEFHGKYSHESHQRAY